MAKRVSLKGKGAELFFGDLDANAERAEQSTDASISDAVPPQASTAPIATPKPASRRKTSRRSTKTTPDPGDSARRASTMPALVDADAIEAIRQVIKSPGREVSFVRLTPEEKAQLSDIVYTYKRQGQKTSETEINRIALNYLLLDFHEHGEQSVLSRVLAALIA